MKVLAISCMLFAIASAGGRSCRKPTSIPDDESSSSGYSLECGIPTLNESLLPPSQRTKSAVGKQKVKDFYKSEKRKERKKMKMSSSTYPPPLVLKSSLKVPDRQKSVKFGWVSSRDPRDIDSVKDIDLSVATTPPPPRDLDIPFPGLVRQKSSRKLSTIVTKERFEERDPLSTPRSSNPPSPPIRQESSSPRIIKKDIKEFWDDDERVFMSGEPIIPSSPRSNNLPSPPIRKESIPKDREWSWDVEKGGFVSDLEEGDIEGDIEYIELERI
jgi:hypothetical protein